MKKLMFLVCFITAVHIAKSQDLTGTWEGDFITGNVGLRQTSKMILELVQVEGRLYGIFDLYPIDTRKNDKPNITYTVEGKCRPETVRFSLVQGRIVEGTGGPDFVKFIFERKVTDTADMLTGKWFRDHESLNSVERGAGSFVVTRITTRVSKRLFLPQKEKEILESLRKQEGRK
ncbi:MAG TPA: hypothetical protein VGD17_11585 [Chitinophagaceae bacterium]